MDPAIGTLDLLGEGRFFEVRERTSIEIWRQVQSGLPIESLESVMKRLPSSRHRHWRRLVTSGATGPRLSPGGSEQTARLAFVLALAKDVWGSWPRALAFLQRDHRELDGKNPLEAAESEWGAKQVEQILRKIQFGLPA